MKVKGLVCLMAVVTLLASAGVVCAYDEIGTTTTFGEGAATTLENYSTIVGSWAGNGNGSTGFYNTFIGAHAGKINTTGYQNTFLGYEAGYTNTTGGANTFLGNRAGYANTTGNANTFLGQDAGSKSTTADFNTFVGTNAGYNITTGASSTFIGGQAGMANQSGHGNTFLGFSAGVGNTGLRNTLIGAYAGLFNNTGNWNTFVGYAAGNDNTSGSGNVFLGNRAGFYETGSNKLYIANEFTTTPLIYGEFDNKILTINGNLGIGTKTPARQLHVAGPNAVFRMDRSADTAAFMLVRTDTGGNPLKTFVVGTNASGANTGEFVINDLGTAVAGGGTRRMTITNNGAAVFTGIVSALDFYPTSSVAFKTNVQTYENALDTVNRLRGVRFDWKESGKPSVGLIAEEVDRVIPEVVSHEGGAAKGVNYAALIGVLVEAVKEQQAQRDSLVEALKEERTERVSLKAEVQQQREALTKQQEAISLLTAEITRLKSRDMIAQR
jgi:hypothetical protein